jgi:ATP-dependent DNA helicase RecQ
MVNSPISLLKKYFGYDSFRPMQEDIITAILDKKDALVLMPTGGGKSVCFQIPALILPGTCVVISPLIALMKDQVEGLCLNGIQAAGLNSSLSREDEIEVIARCHSGDLKLLYLSPEKAIQLADTLLTSFPVSLIAIDEAHCISSWGHDFRPEYSKLKMLRTQFPGVPVVALTATADKVTRKDIINQLALDAAAVFISSFDRPNLSLQVHAGVKEKEKMSQIETFIRERGSESGIIYCLSRNSTEDVAFKLKKAGISCAFYHAGMKSEERAAVQEAFINDEVPVICATIAFGMGIDKSNVRWVIHYNMPKNMEGYYQEIGRAGRDGMASDTILYYNLKDLILLTRFAKESGQPELSMEKLKRIQQYAEARVCRRKILLSYFGETATQDCGNCDVCKNPPKFMDGTILAQKALSGIIRLGEKVGTTMLIHVLRGSQSGEVMEHNYHKIKTYGAGKELSFDAWSHYMLQLLQLGLVEMAYDENFALKVTPFGKEVLYGKASVQFANLSPIVKEKPSKTSVEVKTAETNAAIFEALRKVRKQIAEKENLPPYLIFHDKTLREMASRLPGTMKQMLDISGISENKFDKYGQEFLDVIRTFHTTETAEEVPAEAMLVPEKLEAYREELNRSGIPFSPQLLSKILSGKDGVDITPVIRELPFYGILNQQIPHKILLSELGQYFTEKKKQLKKMSQVEADSFFDLPYNKCSKQEKEKIVLQIRSFPILRPTETIGNDFILEKRKNYPRAYEPWTEEESHLFMQSLDKTNDLDFLALAFQRNPESLKAFFRKKKESDQPV